jgi:hypothetical protein
MMTDKDKLKFSDLVKQRKTHRQLAEAELILESTYKQMSTITSKIKGCGNDNNDDDRTYSILKDITDDIEFHMKTCKQNKEIMLNQINNTTNL